MSARSRIVAGLGGALALLFVNTASAVLVSTSGVWSSVEEDDGAVADILGLGTNNVTWGEPFPAGATTPSSGYVFDGIAPPVDVPTDGSVFMLGEFTHDNFPIFLPSITGATLELTLDFAGDDSMFTYFFEHDETPNEGTCDPAGATTCPDVVSIPDASSTETVTIGGDTFLLTIVGFSEDGGMTIVDEFITEEGLSNSAELFARFDPVEVPAPAPLAALALTLLLTGFAARRTRR